MSASVVDEPCVESIDQLWTLIPAVGGLVQFENAETGWCIGASCNSRSAGERILQWGCGASPSGTCKAIDSPNDHTFSLG